jgi:hypothetical protein
VWKIASVSQKKTLKGITLPYKVFLKKRLHLPNCPKCPIFSAAASIPTYGYDPITAMAVATDFHRTFLFNVPTRHNRPQDIHL